MERLKRLEKSVYWMANELGKSDGNLSNILKGAMPSKKSKSEAKPPLDEMDRWAEVLGLDDDGRDQLIELAELAHAPQRIRDRYMAMKAQLCLPGKKASPAQLRKAARVPFIPRLPDEAEMPALSTSDWHG